VSGRGVNLLKILTLAAHLSGGRATSE